MHKQFYCLLSRLDAFLSFSCLTTVARSRGLLGRGGESGPLILSRCHRGFESLTTSRMVCFPRLPVPMGAAPGSGVCD